MVETDMLLRFLRYTTGLLAVNWDGTSRILSAFEEQHCFSAQAQSLLTAQGLQKVLERMQPNFLYETIDLLGLHMFAFLFQGEPFFVGPFVAEGWDDTEAELRLAGVGLPATQFLPYKLYYCSYPLLEQSAVVRIVTGAITALLPNSPPYTYRKISGKFSKQKPDVCIEEAADFERAVRHYELENRFISLVEQGHTEAALEVWGRMENIPTAKELSSKNLQSLIANATVLRTLTRKAAERGGVHPAVIDAISLAYAQKMYTAQSRKELMAVMPDMIREFSDAVHNTQAERYTPTVSRAISYLQLHVSQQVDMDKIAASAKCSSNYLGRRFKEETGMSVAQYLAQERCRIAAMLLIQTDLPISEISTHVGYYDSNYFVKVFRKCIGDTPTAYRGKFRR